MTVAVVDVEAAFFARSANAQDVAINPSGLRTLLVNMVTDGVVGAQGAQGASGASGAAGAQGAQGAQGVHG